MTTLSLTKVQAALALLGINDPTEVATVVIVPQTVTVTRYPKPGRLDEVGDITTETEVIAIVGN